MLQSLHQLIQVWVQSISLLWNFVFHSLIRLWLWFVEQWHSFLDDTFPEDPDRRQAVLGGMLLNTLLEAIRRQIASLMRWYPNRDEEEEDCLPTTGAKRKKSGRWLMIRMPWEEDVEEMDSMDKTSNGKPSCDAIEASYRHVMHSYFGHQSWALHTLVVAMVAYQIAYIQIVRTHAQVCMCMHI